MMNDPHKEKQQTILDATRRLLIRGRFQDLALDDVAKEAGVAKGTLFLYYRSKDALVSAAYADLVDRLGERLAAVAADDSRGKTRLKKLVCAILNHFETNRDFSAHFGAGRFPGCASASGSRLIKRFKKNLSLVTVVLKTCAKEGLLRPVDFELAGASLFGLCRSSTLYHAFAGRRGSVDKKAAQIVDLFLNGVGK
jgi:TetR/AcrR family fatty acid metabolism transcriptional regulator